MTLRLAARPVVAFSLSLLALNAPAAAQSGALELFVGETLFVSGTRAALTYLHVEGGDLVRDGDATANPAGFDKDKDVIVASYATNLRRGLDAAVVLPWISYNATYASSSGVLSTDEGGIGDLALVLKQRVYHDVWNRGAWNMAVLAGVETPTGDTNQTTGGQLRPPTLQSGSGSWDPFLAAASTWEQGRFRTDAQIFWQTFGEGDQDYTFGDLFSAEVDVGYRVLMSRYPGQTVGTKAGLRWRHRQRAKQAGTSQPNSGGDEVALVGIVSWHPAPAWDVSFRAETPIYQDLNGTQIETDYRVLVGLGLRF